MFFVEIENVDNLYTSARGFYRHYKTLNGLLRHAVNNETHALNHAMKQGATIKIYEVSEHERYNENKYKLVYTI